MKLIKDLEKSLKNEKVVYLDIIDELLEKSKDFWDLERSEFFGTKTSLYGQNLQAKLFGLKILPSLFNQKIKSIIFDLDDTFYTGTIGEDGIKSIYQDKNQKKAEKIYSSLKKKEPYYQFAARIIRMMLLKFLRKKLIKKLFFPIIANWKTKSSNIKEIQKKLKVSFHNILFVDNNISEVIEVKKNSRYKYFLV